METNIDAIEEQLANMLLNASYTITQENIFNIPFPLLFFITVVLA